MGLLLLMGVLTVVPAWTQGSPPVDGAIFEALGSQWDYVDNIETTDRGIGAVFQDSKGNRVFIWNRGLDGVAFQGNFNDPAPQAFLSVWLEGNVAGLPRTLAAIQLAEVVNEGNEPIGVQNVQRIGESFSTLGPGNHTVIADVTVISYGANNGNGFGQTTSYSYGGSPVDVLIPGGVVEAALFNYSLGGFSEQIPTTLGGDLDDVFRRGGTTILDGVVAIGTGVSGLGKVAKGTIDLLLGDGSITYTSLRFRAQQYVRNINESVGNDPVQNILYNVEVRRRPLSFGDGYITIEQKNGSTRVIPLINGIRLERLKNNGKETPKAATVPGLLGYTSSQLTELINDETTFSFFGSNINYTNDGVIIGDNQQVITKFQAVQALVFSKNDLEDVHFEFLDGFNDGDLYNDQVLSLLSKLDDDQPIPNNILESGNFYEAFSPYSTSVAGYTFSLDASFQFPTNVNFVNPSVFSNGLDFSTPVSSIDPILTFTFTDLPSFNFRVSSDDEHVDAGGFHELDQLYPIPSFEFSSDVFTEEDFLSRLFSADESRVSAASLFNQALSMPLSEQRIVLDKQPVQQPDIDLYQHTYQMALTAKKQLHDWINKGSEAVDIHQVWIDALQQANPKMYQAISGKLDSLYRVTNQDTQKLLEANNVFIAPKFSFSLEVRPQIPVYHSVMKSSLKLDETKYEVDLVLTNATLRLGVDDNCDGTSELGLVLTEEEQAFLQDAWAKDTNGDGLIDQGFIIWLNQRMRFVKTMLKTQLELGNHSDYADFNQALVPLALAEFYKQTGAEDARINQWGASEGTIPTKGSWDQHLSLNSTLEGTVGDEQYISFDPAQSIITIHPIEFLNQVLTVNKSSEGDSRARVNVNDVQVLFKTTSPSVVLKNDYSLISGRSNIVGVFITNTSGNTINNEKVNVTITSQNEVGFYDITAFFINQLGPNETAEFTFDYEPQFTGDYICSLHDGEDFSTVLGSRNVQVYENPKDAVNLDAYCDIDLHISRDIPENTDVDYVGGRLSVFSKIEASASAVIQATQVINLEPGFEAKPGSSVDIQAVDCNELKTTLNSALE